MVLLTFAFGAAEPQLSYVLSVVAAIFVLGILAAWVMRASSVTGTYTEWPVLGKGDYKHGTCSNMIQ